MDKITDILHVEVENEEGASTDIRHTPTVNPRDSLELSLHVLNVIIFTERFSSHLRIEPIAGAFATKLPVPSLSDGEADVKCTI